MCGDEFLDELGQGLVGVGEVERYGACGLVDELYGAACTAREVFLEECGVA